MGFGTFRSRWANGQASIFAGIKKHYQQNKWFRWFVLLFGGGLGAVVLFYLLVLVGVFGHVPSKKELRNVDNPVASVVYAADSTTILGKYYVENRTNADFRNISPFLLKALVSTEDVRFYQHGGIDAWSIPRVLFKSVLLRQNTGGGSTITQQLAKNLFPRKSLGILSMPVNKCREMIIARRLEKVYLKDEILTLYLNTVSFGEDIYGIEAATKRYFSTTSFGIKAEEAAVLVGMLKATTLYNPRRDSLKSIERRNVVLTLMHKNGYLAAAAADSLQELPLQLRYSESYDRKGVARYFMEHVRKEVEGMVKDLRQPDGDTFDLFTDGLQIYTTIEPAVQELAEQAVRTHITKLQKEFENHWGGTKIWAETDPEILKAVQASERYQFLKQKGLAEENIMAVFKQAVDMEVYTFEGKEQRTMSPMDSVMYYLSFLHTGMVVAAPATGDVLAWVGGSDYGQFQYDHVTANRQVGSIFKPLVYTIALRDSIMPCDYFANERISYTQFEGWTPENADYQYGGYYSVKGALANSINTIAAQAIMKTGVHRVRQLAKQMGVKVELPNVPSIALGSAEIPLLQMTEVYSTFANKGFHKPLVYIRRVETQHGEVIYDASKDVPTGEQILSYREYRVMANMMRGVVDSGTGRRLRYDFGLWDGNIAGKTGTTQNNADGWFMGFTPDLVAGVWVGGDHPKVSFRSTRLGNGATMALPIWGHFMRSVVQNPDLKKQYAAHYFPRMDSSAQIVWDCPDYRGGVDTFHKVDNVPLQIVPRPVAPVTPTDDGENTETPPAEGEPTTPAEENDTQDDSNGSGDTGFFFNEENELKLRQEKTA